MITNLKKLTFKNFLSAGNKGITYDFTDDKSVTLVFGANGVGKSIFLDALFYGLMGKPFRKIKINQLVNRLNDKNCMVELEFHKGSDVYIIKRGLKPKIFEIYKNGTAIDDTSNSTLQNYLENYILEGSKNILSQFIINDKFKNFMKLTRWEKRAFLEEIISYLIIFSEMNKVINYKKSELTKDINQNNVTKQVQSNSLEHLINNKNKSTEEIKVQVEDLKNKLIEIKNEITDITEYKEKKDNYKEMKDKINRIERKMYDKLKDLKKLIKKHDEYERENKSTINCPHCGKLIDLFRYFENINLDEVTEKLDELESKYNKVKDKQDKIENSYNNIRNILNKKEKLKSKAIVYKEQYQKLRNKKIDVIDNLDGKIKDIETKLKEIDKERENLLKLYRYYEIIQNELICDEGLRRIIIRNIVPYINNKINHYLRLFKFDTHKLKFNEDFDAIIKYRGEEISYESLSEGEKRRCDFSILFAFLSFIQMKAIFQFNVIVMDEIIDNNIDLESAETLLQILKNDKLFENKNVIIVSHKEIPFNYFDRVISVTKPANFSVYSELNIEDK